jgi:hypothetical protein
MNNYFNNKDVKEKLGIPEEKYWNACNLDVFHKF